MWSLNLISGLIVAVVLIVAAVMLSRFWYGKNKTADSYDGDMFLWLARGAIAFVVVVVGITALTTFPWEKQYHYWEDKAGVVAEIESRLLKDGDGMSEKYAVRFEGSAQEYGCEDTRCSLVKPGDTLTLRCLRVWEYSGTDGWDCSYVGVP